jgi:Cu/Ag efflux pump CusA
MIERLIDFSIRNRALVILGVLLVGAVGLRAAQELPIDAVPDVTNVQVQVLTTAPALGPLEVEKFITFPVETVMSGLPRLAEVRSLSKFGLSSGRNRHLLRETTGRGAARRGPPSGPRRLREPDHGPHFDGVG